MNNRGRSDRQIYAHALCLLTYLHDIPFVFRYCVFKFGETKKKGRVCHQGGSAPFFGEEEFEFWIGEDGWTNELVFACYDEDVGSDDLIGGKRFSVFDYMYVERVIVIIFSIFSIQGVGREICTHTQYTENCIVSA